MNSCKLNGFFCRLGLFSFGLQPFIPGFWQCTLEGGSHVAVWKLRWFPALRKLKTTSLARSARAMNDPSNPSSALGQVQPSSLISFQHCCVKINERRVVSHFVITEQFLKKSVITTKEWTSWGPSPRHQKMYTWKNNTVSDTRTKTHQKPFGIIQIKPNLLTISSLFRDVRMTMASDIPDFRAESVCARQKHTISRTTTVIVRQVAELVKAEVGWVVLFSEDVKPGSTLLTHPMCSSTTPAQCTWVTLHNPASPNRPYSRLQNETPYWKY